MKVRQDHRITSVAVINSVGFNDDGLRSVLGMEIGASEAETFWTGLLRKLTMHGLRGVRQVISDAHPGIKAAASISCWNRTTNGWRQEPATLCCKPLHH